jgi:hypothetical protein
MMLARAALVLAILATPLLAAAEHEPKAAGTKQYGVTSGAPEKPAVSAKDPLKDAFKLPRRAVLRPEQQTALDGLKQQWEPKLREALDKVAAAPAEREKLKAVREVNKIRGEIQQAILAICIAPPPGAGGAPCAGGAGHGAPCAVGMGHAGVGMGHSGVGMGHAGVGTGQTCVRPPQTHARPIPSHAPPVRRH